MILKNTHRGGARSRPADLADGLPASRSGGSAVGAAKRLPMRAVATLCAFALVVVASVGALTLPAFAAPGDDANASATVYVASYGNDAGVGTVDDPYQTLAHAVENAPSGATVYVMTDLTMSESARFWNKHLTITSVDPANPVKLSRGEVVGVVNDQARKNYNPALIEVNGTNGAGSASLVLSNIVIDDRGQAAAGYFIQADSEGDGVTRFGKDDILNTDIAQDAIIAAYNGVATITLKDGAVLENFGGMSAVRISSGELVMESGSVIRDTSAIDRTKGEEIEPDDGVKEDEFKGYYGPAGAVWMQGGTLAMEKGSEISDIAGRAIYADGGTVEIDGTISNIGSDADMWWGTTGSVMHLRSGANAILGETGVVDGENRSCTGSSIGVLGGCSFTAEAGSVIENIAGASAVDVSGTATLNGEITGCSDGGHAILAQSEDFTVTIGATANIHRNTCWYGVIYTQSTQGEIHIYGKINDNVSTDRGGALAQANNNTHTYVTMYDGAEICRNVSYQTGGGVMVSCGTFTMEGGTISDNVSGVGSGVSAEDQVGGGVFVRRGGQFVMNGGTVANNSAAGFGGNIALEAGDSLGNTPYVELNGGTVSGGMMNVTATKNGSSYMVSGGTSNDLAICGGSTYGTTSRYLVVSGAAVSNPVVFMDDYDFFLEPSASSVKLGNASEAAESAIRTALESRDLTDVVGSFWYESSRSLETFDLSGLAYDDDLPLFVATVATDETGSPLAGAEVSLQAVMPSGGSVSLALAGGNPHGYAVAFVQENDDLDDTVVVVPADITIYMGGENGYEAVVGSGDDAQETSGGALPHPLFFVRTPEGVNAESLVFTNKHDDGTSNSWKLKCVGGSAGEAGAGAYYRFVPTDSAGNELEDGVAVRVQFSDGKTTIVESDFDPAEVGELFKRYAISIYPGESGGTVTAEELGDAGEYAVATGSGVLTVRAVAAPDADATLGAIRVDSPSEPLASGTAVAVVPESGTTYTLNDTGVQIPAESAPSLLFDEIYGEAVDDAGTTRLDLLEDAIDDELGDAEEYRCYEIRYLDLVDGNNGNAWITSSAGIDIVWAYPEGADSSTKFYVLHFEDLHRDGETSGFDPADIATATIEHVGFERTEQGIAFHVEPGGFSPFAVVWEVPAYTITASAGDGGSISPEGAVTVGEGMDATFTITPDAGYEISQILVDGQTVGLSGIVGADGSATYTFGNVHDNHTIAVSFTKTGGGIVVPPVEKVTLTYEENGGAPLDDVIVSAGSTVELATPVREGYTFEGWYFDEALTDFAGAGGDEIAISDDTTVWAAWSRTGVPDAFTDEHVNYIVGRTTGEGSLIEPLADVTRAEVAAMVFRLLDDDVRADALASAEGVAFPDVAEGTWYTASVAALASLGAIEGYPDGYFRPDQPITRAEFAAIVTHLDSDFVEGEWYGDLPYTDVPEDHWAQSVLSFATNRGWLMGDSSLGVTFRPDDTIQRAEAMAVLNRVLQRLPETEADLIDDRIVWPDNQDPTAWYYLVVEEATNAHDHALKDDGVHERWTALLPNVDWDGLFAAKEDAAA